MAARPRLILLCVLAGAIAVAGFLALGLPGFAILPLATFLAGLVSPARLGGDQVWPAALLISLLGPFALVPAYLVAERLAASRLARFLLTAAATIMIDVAATTLGILLAAT